MRQTLNDYYYILNYVPLLCDNESILKIAYNPYEHYRTKHINIRHYFLRDHVIKGDIEISHVRTNEQLTDIFIKPLDERRFRELRSELNIIDSQNVVELIVHMCHGDGVHDGVMAMETTMIISVPMKLTFLPYYFICA
jgi:hypothetical protein